MKKGKHTKESNKRRNRKQKVKEKYSKAREEAQLAGVIPTEPAGAVRNEVVNPTSQDSPKLPGIDREAVRNGWAVPEQAKPVIVNRLLEPFLEEPVVITDDNGNERKLVDRHLLKENAKVLLLADKMQYERDNPEAAGKAKGSVVVNNIPWEALAMKMVGPVEDPIEGRIGEIEKLPPKEVVAVKAEETKPEATNDKTSQNGSNGTNGHV